MAASASTAKVMRNRFLMSAVWRAAQRKRAKFEEWRGRSYVFSMEKTPLFAIMGITGQVGGAVARNLLAAKQPVRAVVRDAGKGAAWAKLGCEIALADVRDEAALAAAFTGATGVFVLMPPSFDPVPDFPEDRAAIAAVRSALETARPSKVVCLSTIGAQATQPNLLTQRTLMEQALGELPMLIAFLRPAWFMENAEWDVPPALAEGKVASFLAPLERAIPMVATTDIAAVAARVLQGDWEGRRIVEIEGPQPYSPNDLARTLGEILGHPVAAEAVPREQWEELFRTQGSANPAPRIEMIDGFNRGWIDFERAGAEAVRGNTPLSDVLQKLVEPNAPARS